MEITRTEFVKEWIKDLRSGSYRQGKNMLCTVPKSGRTQYCCLGIACKTALRLGVDVNPHWKTSGTEGVKKFFDWFGTSDPTVESADDTCSGMNDKKGCGFKKIASHLEKTFLKGE